MAKPRKKLPVRVVTISCNGCGTKLFKYHKNGKSALIKCFIQRISVNYCTEECVCPHCKQCFARPETIRGTPAYKIIGGKIKIRWVVFKEHSWVIKNIAICLWGDMITAIWGTPQRQAVSRNENRPPHGTGQHNLGAHAWSLSFDLNFVWYYWNYKLIIFWKIFLSRILSHENIQMIILKIMEYFNMLNKYHFRNVIT